MAKPPAAFLSYVRFEDKQNEGRITALRQRLEGEIRIHIGQAEFTIFYDRQINWGEEWQERIESVLDGTTFFIPILTPLFFESQSCRDELERFLQREAELKRRDLILPIHYVDTEFHKKANDPLAAALAARQLIDWRELRLMTKSAPRIGREIAEMARQVKAALARSTGGSDSGPAQPRAPRTLCVEVCPTAPRSDVQTPRAWGCLDIPPETHWRFRAVAMGEIVSDGPSAQRHTKLTPDENRCVSLAMSPDGTVIATLAERQLRVAAVNPRNGKIYPWKGPTPIPRKYRRILAVAPKGDLDVWLAFAEEGEQGRTFRISYTDLEKTKNDEDVAAEVGKGGQETYATFLGASLWFVEPVKMQLHAETKRVLKRVPFGEKEEHLRRIEPWADMDVVAVDAARVGGRTYVALLVKDARTTENTQLFVVPEPADESVGSHHSRLWAPATHVSVVRAPEGDPGSVCVFYGDGVDMKPTLPWGRSEMMVKPSVAKDHRPASAPGGSA